VDKYVAFKALRFLHSPLVVMKRNHMNTDSTAGLLIDYGKLKDFLIKQTYIQKAKSFFDAPCGEGSLLKLMENEIGNNHLLGLDLSDSQLALAKSKTSNVKFIKEDIFEMERVQTLIDNSCYLHIGGSFLNALKDEERKKLLQVLYRIKGVKYLGFEVQNQQYQKQKFIFNKWYEEKLATGITLKTTSRASGNESFELEVQVFRGIEKLAAVTEQLYFWGLEDCRADLLDAGWRDADIKHASYRNENELSHYYIEVTK